MLFQTSGKYFSEVIAESQKRPVLIDFYASWCSRCRVLAPELDALSDRLENQISAYSVNTDTEQALAETYQVKELPTVILLDNEQISGRWEKNVSASEIEQYLHDKKIRLS